MFKSCSELPKNCLSGIPSELHDVLRLMANNNLLKGMDSKTSLALAWASVVKMTGIYTSVKPDEATALLLEQYIKDSGLPNPVSKDDLHVTVISSKMPLIGYKPLEESVTVNATTSYCEGSARENYSVRILDKKNKVLALCFQNSSLSNQYWHAYDLGYSMTEAQKEVSNYGSFFHVTLTYNLDDYDYSGMQLPTFDMTFLPETVEAYKENWSKSLTKAEFGSLIAKQVDGHVKDAITDVLKEQTKPDKSKVEFYNFCKVDEDQRLVYGWANITSVDGEPVQDLQGDYIDDEDLMKAAHDFIIKSRRGDAMHCVEGVGEIVESVVFTKDIQNSLGIDLGQTGWFIGVKVDNDKAWDLVKSGDFKGFSIGGKATKEPVYE